MSGLQRVLKLYGSIKVQSNLKEVEWVWNYANDEAVIKSEMTEEQWMASEKAKYSRGMIKHVGADKIEYGKTDSSNS